MVPKHQAIAVGGVVRNAVANEVRKGFRRAHIPPAQAAFHRFQTVLRDKMPLISFPGHARQRPALRAAGFHQHPDAAPGRQPGFLDKLAQIAAGMRGVRFQIGAAHVHQQGKRILPAVCACAGDVMPVSNVSSSRRDSFRMAMFPPNRDDATGNQRMGVNVRSICSNCAFSVSVSARYVVNVASW